MACRLFGAKPLSKPMLGSCQLDLYEQTSVKFWWIHKTFHSQKLIWKYRLWNGGHFVQGKMSSWWRHQMETFSALLAICVGNSPVTGEFPTQRPVKRSFDVFFDLHLNKRLSKQSCGWWFETPSCPLWSHCNDFQNVTSNQQQFINITPLSDGNYWNHN